ncbi:S8 family peptidase [Streptomyces gardneri]|uniref:S8 family peptidase n=1 Tax=Streptomyces gardneri TaxID=66892 RepID=UPI0033F263B0
MTAYILDTGIDYTHDEFGGRATFGFDAMGDGRYGQDCNGHGTHVAGTVAGRTYGVARKADLVSVRVLGCDGRGAYSGMIAGLDWVAKNARQPAVLNGSLGGDKSVTLNNAATALANAGVLPVIAAGNDAKDACNVSPASATGTVTVAASNARDEETSFSNHGRCVELFAPGQDIVSARIGGGSIAQNGTSMAAPHVAGVAALYKAEHPTAAPAEISAWLDGNSTKGLLTSISSDTPNTVSTPAGLGTFTYTDTLSTTAPWSVTVATTDLVSGTDTIGWNNLRITTGGHLNGIGGQWTGIAKPGPGGHFPEGADPQPGTSLSPAVTMATGDGGTRGVFTHDGSTAQWNIPAETVPGSYGGTLQYTITG